MWQEVPKRCCHIGISLQSLDCFHHSKRLFEAVSWILSWKVHFCSFSTFCPKQLQTDLCLNSLNQLMVELWAHCLLSPVTLCWARQRNCAGCSREFPHRGEKLTWVSCAVLSLWLCRVRIQRLPVLSGDGNTSEEEEGSKAGQCANCSNPLLETKGNLCQGSQGRTCLQWSGCLSSGEGTSGMYWFLHVINSSFSACWIQK